MVDKCFPGVNELRVRNIHTGNYCERHDKPDNGIRLDSVKRLGIHCSFDEDCLEQILKACPNVNELAMLWGNGISFRSSPVEILLITLKHYTQQLDHVDIDEKLISHEFIDMTIIVDLVSQYSPKAKVHVLSQ